MQMVGCHIYISCHAYEYPAQTYSKSRCSLERPEQQIVILSLSLIGYKCATHPCITHSNKSAGIITCFHIVTELFPLEMLPMLFSHGYHNWHHKRRICSVRVLKARKTQGSGRLCWKSWLWGRTPPWCRVFSVCLCPKLPIVSVTSVILD